MAVLGTARGWRDLANTPLRFITAELGYKRCSLKGWRQEGGGDARTPHPECVVHPRQGSLQGNTDGTLV